MRGSFQEAHIWGIETSPETKKLLYGHFRMPWKEFWNWVQYSYSEIWFGKLPRAKSSSQSLAPIMM